MASSLRLPLPTFSDYSAEAGRRRRRRGRPLPGGLPCCCVSANSDGQDRNTNELQTLLIERYGNGMAKRYVMDSESRLRTVLEDHVDVADRLQKRDDGAQLDWIPYFLKDFVLPAGFPGSVSEDYLDYMLLQFPTNVTGWICHTLVTSSLLTAVGIGTFTGTSAAASAAAIRWVSKDGLGAVGRLFIGGRFGNLFDDDPKKWRMYADFIGSAGRSWWLFSLHVNMMLLLLAFAVIEISVCSIFELATPLAPSYFLPLASLGNLAKAVARGLKDPSFRVIQNHFATSGNLGEVAAKEEVWEVAAQLVGLAFGILIIDHPGLQISYSTLVATWLTLRILHLWLRYQSLSTLRFNTINLKRSRLLVESHVKSSVVPGYAECNQEENILSWEKFSKPRIVFGTSMEDMLEGNISCYLVRELLELYTREKYLLFVRQQQLTGELEFYVSFKVGATGLSVMRSVWQSYWLFEHWEGSNNLHAKLEQSLLILDEKFSEFMHLLNEGKWDIGQINLKVPKELAIELVSNVQ